MALGSILFILAYISHSSYGLNLNNQVPKLTSIPWTLVSDSEIKLVAQNNELLVLDPPVGKQLEIVKIFGNNLTEFPDLFNIKDTLKELGLGANQISWIEPTRLSQLTVLEELHIQGNYFVVFPDAKYFPPRLWSINLSATELIALPNMCYLNVTDILDNQLQIRFYSNVFHCDHSMFWTKLGLELGFLRIDDIGGQQPDCFTPLSIKNVTLVNMTNQQLITGTCICYLLDKLMYPCKKYSYV